MPRERPHSTGVESATHTSGKAGPSTRSRDRAHDAAGDRPLGPHAAQIVGTEHWSLLAARSLIWNEAQSRATVFLTVLSASPPTRAWSRSTPRSSSWCWP